MLFAAAHSQSGSANDLAVAGVMGRVELTASRYVIAEVVRNLKKKSPRGLRLVDELTSSRTLVIVDAMDVDVERVALLVDRKDAPVIAAAMAANAPVVATYDRKHLLS